MKKMFDNFTVVEDKKLYRSRQLDAKRLDYYIKRYGIKTVINLRGRNKGRKWWEEERDVIRENNIKFYNISMRAYYLPSRINIKKLCWVYKFAPKPILIHCRGGADRTGMASAIWQLLNGRDKKISSMQLSFKYGHNRYKSYALDFFIDIWQGMEWLLKEYDPSDYPKYFQGCRQDRELRKIVFV